MNENDYFKQLLAAFKKAEEETPSRGIHQLVHALNNNGTFHRALAMAHITVGIIDLETSQYLYVANTEGLLGRPASTFIEKGTQFTYELANQDDLHALRQLLAETQASHQLSNSEGFYNSFDLRLQAADQTWRRLHFKNYMLAYNAARQPKYQLTICKDITWLRKLNTITLSCNTYAGLRTYTFLQDVERQNPQLPAAQPAKSPIVSTEPLSNQEKRILSMLVNGMASGEIARNLTLAISTVDTHRRNILRKAGCQNTPQLLGYAQVATLI